MRQPSKRSTGRLWAILLVTALMGTSPVAADFLLPNHNHTQTVVNGTGKAANDLHVNLVHPATGGNPTAPPFTTSSGTGATTIDFGGGNVAAGGKAVVNWQSKFASDVLFPGNEGHWTFDGANIGNVTIPAQASLGFTDLGGGLVTVSLINSSSTGINYQNLQVWRGADSSFFDPGNYLGGQFTGTPVGLLVGNSGVFAPGSTDIVTFAPTLSPGTYNSGSALLNGDVFGMGSSSVPEPGPLTLGFVAVPLAYFLMRRRSRVSG